MLSLNYFKWPSNVSTGYKQSARKLGNVSLCWKIHNYTLTVFKRNYSITSPEFQVRGYETTTWQLILQPYIERKAKRLFVFRLRRLDNEPAATLAGADWKIALMSKEGILLSTEKTEYTFFEGNSSYESVVSDDVSQIYKMLNRFKSHTLLVNFQLIVSHRKANNSFHITPDPGLKSLSRNLFALYKCQKYCDVVIRTRDNVIRGHKAILQCRSSYFKYFFEIRRNIPELDFTEFSYKTVNNMLSYLYSGMLEFVLGNPTIAMYDCAKRLKIGELQQYYCLDTLDFESKVDVSKKHIVWNISDFKTRDEDMIESPIVKFSNLELCLKLIPEVRYREQGYVVVFIKFRCESEKRYILYMMLGIINRNEELVSDSTQTYRVKNEALFEFSHWSKGVVNSLVPDYGDLIIDYKFQVCDTEASWETSLTCSILCSFSNPDETKHSYSRLSNDMRFLLTNASLSNSKFFFKSKKFEVHKGILAARSYIFRKDNSANSTKYNFYNRKMKSHIANIFMDYLYGGILNNCNSSDAMELYDVSGPYFLPILKVICSQFLQSCLTVENVSDIFIFADKKQDGVLKDSALKFISLNFKDVSAQHSFQQLEKSLFSNSQASVYNSKFDNSGNKTSVTL